MKEGLNTVKARVDSHVCMPVLMKAYDQVKACLDVQVWTRVDEEVRWQVNDQVLFRVYVQVNDQMAREK